MNRQKALTFAWLALVLALTNGCDMLLPAAVDSDRDATPRPSRSVAPSSTPAPSPAAQRSASPTPTPSPSRSPGASPSPSPSPKPSPSPTPSPSPAAGTVTTVAGGATAGHVNGTSSAARFNLPRNVAVDTAGNLYVADTFNNRIRKIASDGTVSLLAGSGEAGYVDDVAASAAFNAPHDVAVNASGVVYVADYGNHVIREISATGVVRTLAGSGLPGKDNSVTPSLARFSGPSGLAIDTDGTLYVADRLNHSIRKVSPAGVVDTLAGQKAGYQDASGLLALFHEPLDLAVGGGFLFVADSLNHCIRKVSTTTGTTSTLAGVAGQPGTTNGSGTAAKFDTPLGIAVDGLLNVYVAEGGSHQIRKITSAGVVTTAAGGGTAGYVDAVGQAARFSGPSGLALDGSGHLLIVDQGNHRVRKWRP